MFERIQLRIDGNNFFTNKLAIELSHLIGFKSVAMEFPLVILDEEMQNATQCCSGDTLFFSITKTPEGAEEGFRVETVGNDITVSISPDETAVRQAYEFLCENFSALTHGFQRGTHECEAFEGFPATKNVPLGHFDNRLHKGLESLLDKDYILLDRNNDLLCDELNAKILLSDSYSREQVAAACHVAARLGLETTAICYPITVTSENYDNLFLFRADEASLHKQTLESNSIFDCQKELIKTDECGLLLEDLLNEVLFNDDLFNENLIDDELLCKGQGKRRRFVFSGDGHDLVDFSSAFCETFPLQKPGSRWLDLLNEIKGGLCMRTVDGQLSYIEHMKDRIKDGTVCYFSPKINDVGEDILKNYAPAKFLGYKDLKKVHEKEYNIPWEVDVCRKTLEEKLWPQVKSGDKVTIRAILSEDRESREMQAEEFAAAALAKGAQLDSAEVICAYKQGFCWLEEIIMPKLRGFKTIDKIEIFFKPYLAPGVTDWQDEDGSVPTYNNLKTDDESKWLDLPIRYLQELYPIDDILASGLKIPRENIIFSEYTGEEDITYLVKATHEEAALFTETYKAVNNERNYLDAYPGMGKVHPGTGWVWAAVNGREIVSERIATDLELVWEIYQEDVLPFCHDYCQKKNNGNPTAKNQPFFAQMRLDISLSEPNEKLACREDMFSSLDSLHEDIYFAGLDFFKVYGNTIAGEIFDAPGLILPVIKKRYGKPCFKFTLYDQHGHEPMINFGDECVKPKFKEEDVYVTIPKVLWADGKLSPVIRIEGPEGLTPVVKSYAKLLSERLLSIERRIKNVSMLRFEVYENGEIYNFTSEVSESPDPPKDLCVEDIDVFESRIIGYDEYINIIEQLKRVPGLSVYLSGESYLGRDIYAVEFQTDYRGYVSRTKLINQNPVLFINARHHANEPSATNAAFMLIKELLTNGGFKKLANRLNLIIVPFENADGAAIHYELQKDNPTWILHIARFNAIGKEFYHEHFKDETIHTEAKGLTKIWRNWLPDIIVDNHGVPAHEWSQQFSGYTAPSYKGFWLPRSLLYGCFWTVKEEAYRGNIPVAKKIEEIVADVIQGDDRLKILNKDLTDRFAKYANKWMPRLFPANYYRDMINVWMYFDFDPNHRYPSVRFPWITTVAYTSEIADETAQGNYLLMCAQTHMKHDIGIIKMLLESKCVFENNTSKTTEGLLSTYYRQRPLIAQ